MITMSPVLRTAVQAVLDGLRDPRYAHTSHLQLRVRGQVLVDEHLTGPVVADVFSITKTVTSLALGVMAGRGLLPALDEPVGRSLPAVAGTPAAAQSWRRLLTMTRGVVTDGPWDLDEITALPGGQVTMVANAPARERVNGDDAQDRAGFHYDSGGFHLLSAAGAEILGEPLAAFAERELFGPLGIDGADWAADPDGVSFGYAHLRLAAEHLGRLGDLLLQDGIAAGGQLIHAGYLAEMLRPQSDGGTPENLPYGLGIWLDPAGPLAGGWAGQHLLVVPAAEAVIVVTGDPRFDLGPPPTDALPEDWRPALDLVRRHLVPALINTSSSD
jgi:CubicO group peptidase (beta-lactamase class C family)